MDPEGTKTAVPFWTRQTTLTAVVLGLLIAATWKKDALESTMVEACAGFYMASNIFLGNLYNVNPGLINPYSDY